MTESLSEQDRVHLARAIELAHEAGKAGNLPIGAVICREDRIIAEGTNAIWAPSHAPYRHAELETLRAIPAHLSHQCPEMTLYTTLEPCLMCAGAILLHRIGRVVFGASDGYGGFGTVVDRLPPFFAEQYARTTWIGPTGCDECDALYVEVMELVKRQARFSG